DGRELNGGKRGALDCLPMRHLDPAVHQRRVWLDVYAVGGVLHYELPAPASPPIGLALGSHKILTSKKTIA
ncbi:MAG: hypothetical protein QXN04_08985, partial [Pyrobaculum sp.]